MTDALLRGLGLLLVVALACLLLSLRSVASATPSTAPAPGTLERDALHGTFWRPTTSAAVRPLVTLRAASWTPAPLD
jgi:hypothetical protein